MPIRPHSKPMSVASTSMRAKLSVSSRAVTAGTTMIAAIIVTPKICIDASTVAARISDSRASAQCAVEVLRKPAGLGDEGDADGERRGGDDADGRVGPDLAASSRPVDQDRRQKTP